MVTIDGYAIDVAVSEDHAFESEVTAHPVEEGADIADHVRARPITVSLEGVVSDTPIGTVATARDAETLPSDEAFTRLQAIRDAREPVTIVTSLRLFRSMVLQSLTVPRSPTNGAALRFRATFVQVQIVRNERTVVEVAVPRAAKKVNRGNKASEDVPSETIPEKTNELTSVIQSIRRWERPTDFLGLNF